MKMFEIVILVHDLNIERSQQVSVVKSCCFAPSSAHSVTEMIQELAAQEVAIEFACDDPGRFQRELDETKASLRREMTHDFIVYRDSK